MFLTNTVRINKEIENENAQPDNNSAKYGKENLLKAIKQQKVEENRTNPSWQLEWNTITASALIAR